MSFFFLIWKDVSQNRSNTFVEINQTALYEISMLPQIWGNIDTKVSPDYTTKQT